MDNICRFVPSSTPPDTVQVLNFVYETKRTDNFEMKISAVYRVHFVTDGRATVQCGSMRREVGRGDLVFVFPSVPYMIEGDEDFAYMYISFIGIRANALTERLGINNRRFTFPDFGEAEPIWREGIAAPAGILDLAGESVLLYTLMKIGARIGIEDGASIAEVTSRFLLVKKYIDDNFSDCRLSLERVAEEFSYNKKYLSFAFKRHFKIGVTEYVNTVRINHACNLIDKNYTSVGDIAYLCGYDDPLYFSRIFKARMGVSPRAYMEGKK